jgi:hypothetical protein
LPFTASNVLQMTVWGWITVGAASFLVLSALVGFAIARILGAVGQEVSELYETEAWAQAPLTRTPEDETSESSSERTKAERRQVVRLR